MYLPYIEVREVVASPAFQAMERHEHGLPRRQEFGLEAGPGDPMWGNPVADGDGAMKLEPWPIRE